MKYLLVFLLVIPHLYASIKWEKIKNDKNYKLYYDLQHKQCDINYNLIKQIKEKNNIKEIQSLSKKQYIVIPNCNGKKTLKYKKVKHSKKTIIKNWESVIVNPGYILSLDLEKRHCGNIWEEQIFKFLEKNIYVKNVEYLDIKSKILVQNCYENEQEYKEVKKQLSMNRYLLDDISYLEFVLGKSLIKNKKTTVNEESYFLGMDYRSNIYKNSGLNFQISYYIKSLILEPILELRNSGTNQFQLKLGTVHIISERENKTFTTGYSKVGFLIRHNVNLYELNVGLSFEKKPTFLFDLSFLKKINNNYYGLFIENKLIFINDVYNNDIDSLILGGFKISF